MNEVHATINVNEIQKLVDWLAVFGATTEGGVTRLLYSKEWVQAQQSLKKKMIDCGMQVYFDSVGNLFGRIEGSQEKDSVILTGSHIDTVVQGGKYDGAYGILASLLAVKRLVESNGQPKKTIEVVSLCEEEGSRFPLTYWGSKNMMGDYSLKTVEETTDKEGVSFIQAMEDAGFPISAYSSKKRSDIKHFLEIHIEQGAVLENNQLDIGLVSHIVGQKRFTISLNGQSNHAGTTPMTERKDAMVCAANAISKLTALAKTTSSSLRVTTGQIVVKPNVPNVIAGNVQFTLDIRHHESEVLEDYCHKAMQLVRTLAEKSGIQLSVEKWTDITPVGLDTALHELMRDKISSKGLKYTTMVSGAGHDAQVFGQHLPTTLLFVPSKNGISHSPLEYTSPEHLENGVLVLMDYLYRLAY
ncbi:allantoate deiminase [Lysinibacillus telephonicus]|uniref:Allantoate amidohydrolase n=1 Tax=Lysinibacillus telephonicus TaxID=1714840 RepID=A0A3S0JUW4_9BACI|nr:allantoate deiminase [Lysinibacillus telephonicus]RTQ91647.1 allantoate amidohydrolase [Lysinibacillus telephonicus]